MDQWEFFTVRLHDNDFSPWLWRWRCQRNGEPVVSAETFGSLTACVEDARRHGFRHGDSDGDPRSGGLKPFRR
jgi:hypothetical protein